MDETTVRLRDIFAGFLELSAEEVNDELRPETCEKWDSLQQIQLVAAIEEEFGIALTLQQQIDLNSFERAVSIVRALTA